MPTFHFAWADEGEAFDPDAHATIDQYVWDGSQGGGERILSIVISEAEGEFPSLEITLRNPGVGLLSAGRNRWCWLSADFGDGAPEPMFTGRLIGIPKQISAEVATLQFVARPPDFIAQKHAIADSLRVLPWWDPVWLQEALDDDDAVLETRTAAWQIGRTDLVVATTDLVTGEAGAIVVDEDAHLYANFDATYSEAPLRRVSVSGTVSWVQRGAGEVDLTRELHATFREAGSPYDYPIIATMTGDGLSSDWPQLGDSIGAGWTVGTSSITPAVWLEEKAYVVNYVDRPEDEETIYQEPTLPPSALTFGTTEESEDQPWRNWEAAFPLSAFAIEFVAHYDAARERSETVTAVIEADVQSLIVEPGAAEESTVELTSEFVGEPIDAGGALPIGDLRRNSYFKTDRGAQSWEYILLLARAQLIARARAVRISLVVPGWDLVRAITCRHSVQLIDRRLPGGEATGKVIGYELSAAAGSISASLVIACTIGYGVALPAATEGGPAYAEADYVDDGYQQVLGGQSTLLTGELLYESFDNFDVADDDGLNLLDMTPRTVVNVLTVAGGPNDQREAIDASVASSLPDPVGSLDATPTVVTLDLKPVDGGAFHVDFAPEVSGLVVPQSIDLEAA